jgi:hypothetical protein
VKRILITISLFAFSSLCFAQNQKSWDGFITDTHCATHCQRTSDMKPDKHCVRLCVRRGSKYGLWQGNHVYPVEPQTKLAQFAAEDVQLTGTMSNGVIQIESIRLKSK